jgi:hypothetical protein
VQRVVAQLPWRQNIALLERLTDEQTRLWYAEEAIQNGWSQSALSLQIDRRAHERHGKAITDFPAALPPDTHGRGSSAGRRRAERQPQ